MSSFKRLIALIMVLTFVLVLVSCGGNTDSDSTTTDKNSKSTNADDTTGSFVVVTDANGQTITNANGQAVTVAGTTKVGQKPASGKTVKNSEKVVATIENKKGYSTISPLIKRTTNNKGNASATFIKGLKGYELKILYPWATYDADSTLGESAAYSRQQVEKQYNVKISESGFFTNYNETLTSNLAARKAPAQICLAQDMNFASYFKNGYIANLSSAMTTAGVDFKDPWYNDSARAFLNINYKQYGWISYDAEYVFPYCIIFNKSVFKSARLTDPATLAAQGKWTWAKLKEYSVKLTSSKLIGFGGGGTQMLASMVAQKGSTLVNVDKGAAPSSNISNQTVKDCLATLAEWCKNNKICNTFSDKDWTYPKTQFVAGKIAMLFGTHDHIQSLKSSTVSDDEFAVAPFPMPTASKTYINVAVPQFIDFVPASFQSEADKILFIRNELYRQSYRFAQRDFQVQWKTYFSDNNVLEDCCNLKYAINGNKTVFNWLSICEDPSANASTANIVAYVIGGSGTVQTAVTKYQNALNKAYKDVWDGYKITGQVD